MLKDLEQKFCEHPSKIGETYCEHLQFALKTGVRLMICGGAAVVHAFFPFWFETFAGDHVPAIAVDLTERTTAYKIVSRQQNRHACCKKATVVKDEGHYAS